MDLAVFVISAFFAFTRVAFDLPFLKFLLRSEETFDDEHNRQGENGG
jgi:hypothetical protein